VKMFDAGKTRMIGLPYDEKTMTIPECHGQTDGRMDRQTDGHNCNINIARQCADAR